MCVPKLNLIGLIVFITKIIEENGMATVRGGSLDTINNKIFRFFFNPETKHIYLRELRDTMCIHDGDQEVQKSICRKLG